MSAPNAPTLSVANAGTGTSATATLTGDAGATHRLFYRAIGTAAWTTGLTRVGDGTITQTGLSAGRTEFIAVSDNGEYSLPSSCISVLVKATATDILEQIRLELLTRLEELKTEGTLAVVTAPKRMGQEPTHRDKEAVLTQQDGATYDPDNKESKSFPTAGCVAWHRRFFVYYWRRLSDASAAAIDTSLNAGAAAIMDRLTDPDRPYSSPTFYVDVEEDLPVSSPDRSCDGRMIVLHVMFEHRAGDAASQT
jgi:hypothetical protein